MASHRKTNAPTLLSLSKRQWIRIVAIAAAIATMRIHWRLLSDSSVGALVLRWLAIMLLE